MKIAKLDETASAPTHRFRSQHWTRKLVLLLILFAVSFWVEFTFDFHENVIGFLHEYERFEADAVIVAIATSLLIFLGKQLAELRREVRWRKNAEAKALHLAFHDSLTGLGNRRKFEAQTQTLKSGEIRAVFMLDLDDFKPINDIFGHAAGDDVLKIAAARLSESCGPGALVCRFGGDEFAILSAPVKNTADAERLARHLVVAFDKPFSVGLHDFAVGMSIGMVMLNVDDLTLEEAMRQADLALYRAKDDPSATFRMFEQRMDDELRRKKLMELKLRKAMALGGVQPHFQPLVNLKSGALIGFEALARWTDPELGYVPPVDFIALAEELNIITELSEYLLRSACREAVRWPSHLKLAFNLSPKQLKDKLIGLRILAILGETGLSPARLEIEVTEGSLVVDKDLARALLESLRDAGVRIAIDDFGIGYSSLNHLREFKFDNLKIGRSFVRNMQENDEDSIIVKTILSLSQGLGLVTTAEGIEREDQLSLLLASGCEQGQGYLFGKAIPGIDVIKMLDEMAQKALRA